MPDWKIHLLFGCLLSIFLFNIFYFWKIGISPINSVLILFLILFSSVFADIDLKKSKIRGFLSLVTAFFVSLIYIFFYNQTWFYAPFYFVILYFFLKYIPSKHRGLTHSFKFSILFSFLLVMLCYFFLSLGQTEILLYFLIIFSSYSLHLILDKL